MQYTCAPIIVIRSNQNCREQTFISCSNFVPDVLFQLLMCAEISSHTLWLTNVPTDSPARRGQKTWLARRRHQNKERCVRDTWLLTHLRAVYAVGPSWLKPQLTIGVVSFHPCLQHCSISCSD